MKKVIYILLVLGILGGSIGFYFFNKPLDSISSMSTDYSLSSNELLTAFEDDETQANEKYLDKVIQVTGKVLKTETENGKTTIYLNTENELSNVIFQLEKDDPSIQAGQQVTMKGICTGYLMDVILVRAIKV